MEQIAGNSRQNPPLPKSENTEAGTISSENLSKEMAYLLGVYLTDGCITDEGKFLLQVVDRDFAENTLHAIKKVQPDCNANIFTRMNTKGKWNKKPQFCISAGFTRLMAPFRNQTGNKHNIPFCIWNAPLPIKRWFIAGVMDGDGYIAYHTRPDGTKQWTIGVCGMECGWIYEFKELLQKMGIKVLKPYRSLDMTKYKMPFVSFNMNVRTFVENGLFFTIGRKQDRVKMLRVRPEIRRSTSYGMKV